uniref:Uncharacterized protein n=1 Tax=Mesocestoides corti TaxID=53468 RepID=A0A5K3F2G6_MESCO
MTSHSRNNLPSPVNSAKSRGHPEANAAAPTDADRGSTDAVVSSPSSDHDRFLLESMLLFALRRRFIKAACKISATMHRCNLVPASLLLWCLNAQVPKVIRPFGHPTDPTDSSILPILEELSRGAQALAKSAGEQSPFCAPLRQYKTHVDKVLMCIYLESPSLDKWPDLIAKLNQKFPPASKVFEIQSFRNDFAKLLMSVNTAERFLTDTWFPGREAAFLGLVGDAQNVTDRLPNTIFDQVGTRNHGLFVKSARKFDTNLTNTLLTVLRNNQEACTEEKLIQIAECLASP